MSIVVLSINDYCHISVLITMYIILHGKYCIIAVLNRYLWYINYHNCFKKLNCYKTKYKSYHLKNNNILVLIKKDYYCALLMF